LPVGIREIAFFETVEQGSRACSKSSVSVSFLVLGALIQAFIRAEKALSSCSSQVACNFASALACAWLRTIGLPFTSTGWVGRAFRAKWAPIPRQWLALELNEPAGRDSCRFQSRGKNPCDRPWKTFVVSEDKFEV
jgi:hypothetical protein